MKILTERQRKVRAFVALMFWFFAGVYFAFILVLDSLEIKGGAFTTAIVMFLISGFAFYLFMPNYNGMIKQLQEQGGKNGST